MIERLFVLQVTFDHHDHRGKPLRKLPLPLIQRWRTAIFVPPAGPIEFLGERRDLWGSLGPRLNSFAIAPFPEPGTLLVYGPVVFMSLL